MWWTNGVAAALCVAAYGMCGPISVAAADEPDIYGYITSDEQQEISANGWRSCDALRAIAGSRAVTQDDARNLVEGYLAAGWDVESAGDIVWESVEAGCGEYGPQVEAAMDTYPPMY